MKGLCFIVNFLLFSLEAFSYSFYEGADPKVVTEFEGHLAEIAKLPTGQILLDRLEEKWGAKNKKLDIVHEEGKSLHFYRGKLFLGPVNGRVGCPVARPIPAGEHPVWAVGFIEEPYYIAVAHELIHCLHWCESEKIYMRQLGNDACHWQDFFQRCSQWRCRNIERYRRLCFSAEEERTVLGDFDTDDGQRNPISEAQLMVEAGLYPRYIYQDPNRHFYECYTILNAILANFGDLSRCQPADAFELNDIPDPRFSLGVQ